MITLISFIIGTVFVLLSMVNYKRVQLVAANLQIAPFKVTTGNGLSISFTAIGVIVAVCLAGTFRFGFLLAAFVINYGIFRKAKKRLSQQMAALPVNNNTEQYNFLTQFYLKYLSIGILIYFIGLIYQLFWIVS